MNYHLPDILIREAKSGNNTFIVPTQFDGIFYLVKILKLQHLLFEAFTNRLWEATNTITISPSGI